MYGVRVNENLREPRVLMGKKAEKRENGYVMGNMLMYDTCMET